MPNMPNIHNIHNTKNIKLLNLPNLITLTQCLTIIALMDNDHKIHSPVTTYNSLYARIFLHLPEITQQVWSKIGVKLQEQFPEYGTKLQSIRPIWSATKYETHGHLGVHMDGNCRYRGMQSFLTLVIYLSDDFEGGQTNYYLDEEGETLLGSVCPEVGMGVVMRQDVFHSGQPVLKGCKYIIRTDICGPE